MSFIFFMMFFLHFAGSNLPSEFIQLENYLLESLSQKAEICQPYEFMCEKFVNYTNENPPKMEHSFSDESFFNNQTKVYVIEAINSIDINDKNVPSHKIWLKTFFDQCQKWRDVNNETALKTELFVMDKLFGPLSEFMKNTSDKSVWNILGRFTVKYGMSSLLNVEVVNYLSENNTTVPIFDISDGRIDTGEINETDMNDLITKSLSILNYTVDENLVRNISASIVKFYQDWNEFTTAHTVVELLQMTDNDANETILNSFQLTENFREFPWREYFDGFLSHDESRMLKAKTTEPLFRIRMRKQLAHLVKFINNQNLIVVQNYFVWSSLYWNHKLSSHTKTPCTLFFEMEFGPALVRTLFDYNKWDVSEWIKEFDMITKKVSQTMKSHVTNLRWMGDQQLGLINKYMDSFGVKYPLLKEWFTNDILLEYRTPKFHANLSFVENFIRKSELNTKNMMKRIFSNISVNDNTDYLKSSPMDLFIPLSRLLPPNFHPKYPTAIKYGLVGVSLVYKIFSQVLADPYLLEGCKVSRKPRQSLLDTSFEYCNQCCFMFPQLYSLSVAHQSFKSRPVTTAFDASSMPKLQAYSQDQLFILSAARWFCDEYSTGGYQKKDFDTMFKLFKSYNKIFENKICADIQCHINSCSTEDI